MAENLLARDFSPSAPDRVWSSDITYIATDEGWLYLACVIDLFSRQVVGWSMQPHMQTSLVADALRMAWFRRVLNLPCAFIIPGNFTAVNNVGIKRVRCHVSIFLNTYRMPLTKRNLPIIAAAGYTY